MRFLLLLSCLAAASVVRAQTPPPPQAPLATYGSGPGNLNSAFNPSLGVSLDTTFQQTDKTSTLLWRSAELNLGAAIDPFLKGFAVINGSDGGIEVEEAILQTTSLPGNLTVTGGRFFASFGRLAHFHDHELPVVNRPVSLDTYIGGESQGDGFEVRYLFPTDLFVEAIAGGFNKIGGENDRVANGTARGLKEYTFLGRLHTYADLGDDHSLDLGVHAAWTPERAYDDGSGDVQPRAGSARTLSGFDLTYRWHPTVGGKYKGLIASVEAMQNDELRVDPATSLVMPRGRQKSYGGFGYVEGKLGRWRPGVLADLTEDPDDNTIVRRTYTGYLTFDVTEFQRLRAQYSRITDNQPGSAGADFIGLQWTGVFGYHVHGFRDR